MNRLLNKAQWYSLATGIFAADQAAKTYIDMTTPLGGHATSRRSLIWFMSLIPARRSASSLGRVAGKDGSSLRSHLPLRYGSPGCYIGRYEDWRRCLSASSWVAPLATDLTALYVGKSSTILISTCVAGTGPRSTSPTWPS